MSDPVTNTLSICKRTLTACFAVFKRLRRAHVPTWNKSLSSSWLLLHHAHSKSYKLLHTRFRRWLVDQGHTEVEWTKILIGSVRKLSNCPKTVHIYILQVFENIRGFQFVIEGVCSAWVGKHNKPPILVHAHCWSCRSSHRRGKHSHFQVRKIYKINRIE